MIVGFNHNITYRGVGFHVQTEDSGVRNPQLVTLLYHGGTIISSQKTTYADIIKVDNLEHVVEDLAKEQHKAMLKKLTHGDFDDKIGTFGIMLAGSGRAPEPPAPLAAVKETVTAAETRASEATAAAKPAATPKPVQQRAEAEEFNGVAQKSAPPVAIVEEPIIDKFNKSARKAHEPSLEDQIRAYLTAGR